MYGNKCLCLCCLIDCQIMYNKDEKRTPKVYSCLYSIVIKNCDVSIYKDL